MIEEILQRLHPAHLLDVGCGCGETTRSWLPLCSRMAAVDPMRGMVGRWARGPAAPGLSFLCMDGRALGFRDRSFDLVVERASLHHIADWGTALLEMLRASSGHVYLEEPVDDLRSPAKENAVRGQALFLELQREVGYPHYPHIPPADLLRFLGREAKVLEQRLVRTDTEVPFEEFFEAFSRFAKMSPRESYWFGRLERFRSELGTGALCESDRFSVLAAKKG